MVQDESAMDELPRGRAREAGADRNLLLGLLAFQRGLIAVESLVDAIHAWVLDKGRPIGSILLEWGSIDQGQLDALGRLVADQLDETKIVPSNPHGTEDAVGSNQDHVGVAVDNQATDILPVSDHDRQPTTTRGRERRPSTPCRYRKPDRQAHARGGLGEVFIADDLELGRKVALKEIRDQNAFDEQSRARFLLEGEVTGNLEHPGIVPVYGLGTYDDGRPYYAMRFIRGKNLRDTVNDLRATRDSADDPGAKDLALRKLLRRFIDVCNAIEYAHSRDVLHRDLKPANIMLGRFGETLVVDWGLAKLIGRSNGDGSTEQADPGEGSLHLSTSSGVEPTRKGALGTLQYMSPEQAAGKLDELGPATDVFGLGTTLYYLLTGQPPFPDGDPGKITAGIYRKPREVDREVPRALEAICVKAMATDPLGRYPSAFALAEDLDRWLGDQPVQAYPDPLTTRVVRWSRRNRTKVATLASLLVAGFIALAISNVVVARERARTETARQTGVDILTLTGSALQKLMVGAVVEQLAEAPGTLKARRELAEGAVAIAHDFSGRWPKDPVVALVAAPTFHMAANLDRSLGDFGRAMANYRDATRLYDAAIDANLPGRGWHQADCIRLTIDHGEALRMSGRREEALAKYDEARQRIDRAEGGSPGDPSNEKALARVCYVKGYLDLELDRPEDARPLFDKAIPLLDKVARRDSKDPDVGLILTFPLLGRAIAAGMLGRLDEADPAFSQALANLEPMAPSSSVRFLRARVHDERGRWLATDRSKLALAEDSYKHAIEIMAGVVKDYSAFPQYRLLLANAHLDRGLVRHEIGKDRDEGARDDARAARDILEGLREESPRMNELHGRLGEALGLLGRLEPDRGQARGLIEAAIKEQDQAIREEPGRRRNEAARKRHEAERDRIKDR